MVAQEAAKRHSVQELARLDCQAAHALVVATVEKLRDAYSLPGQTQTTP